MTNNPRPKDKNENDLIGNILHEGGGQDFFDLRMEMGKSTSAPPPGLSDFMMAPSPDITRERIDITATEDYYNYYHSLKPHDPRLPLPKWKPKFYPPTTFNEFQQHPAENPDMGGLRKGSNPDKFGEMNNFASRFDQAMTLNMNENPQATSFNKPQSPQLRYQQEPKKSLQPQPVPMQEPLYNAPQSPERKSSHPLPGAHNYNKPQHQQHQHQQHQQGQHHQGGYNAQHGQHHHNQNQRSHHQNPRNFEQQQGQYYQGMQQQPQMGGPFFDPNYMQPQMQANPYYGMNAFQPQMYPYGMDPNMAGGQNQFGKMPSNPYAGGNRMTEQMPQMNPMGGMPQMGGMNQFYMNNNPYMNNYYPMGGFQQNQQGGFQQNFPNQNPQQQNRGQKPLNKNPAPKLDIKHVLANLIENCRDQNGSRLIQQHFEKSNEQEKEQLFQQILPHAYGLMTDVFGNYVIQKILELGSLDQKLRLFEAMQGNVFILSQHTYGCRVVQRILEELRSNGLVQDQILEELSQDIALLIEDQNGNHVIQKSFETMPAEKVQFIINEVTKNIDTLAFHPYGCRVIQRILEHSPPEVTAPMLNRLMGSALKCCESQYGNYIMQYILEKGPQAEKSMLLDCLRDNFVRLSMNKFASNVTEKSTLHGTPEFRRDVVNILCSTYHDNRPALVAMMTHSFANYVVQRLFECSDGRLRQTLYDKMQGAGGEEIKKSNYGKHVMNFIDKLMEGN